MTWRERFDRVAQPVVRSIARAVRGDSEDQSPLPTRTEHAETEDQSSLPTSAERAETEVSAVPAWGLLPSQIPPRVKMLRGASSVEILKGAWVSAGKVSVVVAVAGTVILLGRDDIPLFWIVPLALLSGGAARVYRTGRAAARMREEHRAGYTVWGRKALRYPQIDDRTGYVIREAGAPELSKQEQAAEVKRVRDISRFVARHLKTTRDPG